MPRKKPFLSLAERDRRYRVVRDAMRERGLDVLLVWGHSGRWDWHMSNVAYLSQVAGNGEEGLMIFPLEGDPTIVLWHGGMTCVVEGWLEYGSWVKDFRVRADDGTYTTPTLQVLKGKKLTNATIGLHASQITGVYLPKSEFPMGIHNSLREALPKAKFIDASGLIEYIRAVKSDEEIALMKKAQKMGEAAMDTLAAVARPGVPETEVVAAMFHTMLAMGADIPIMFLYGSGAPKYAPLLTFPLGRRLKRGDVILMEFTPRYHGYCSHFPQSAVIGDWPDKGYEKLYEAALASYRGGWNAVIPGITVGELNDAFRAPLTERNCFWNAAGAPGGFRYGGPFFHGEGMGTESVVGSGPVPEDPAKVVIREGVTLAFEPGACPADNSRGVNIGDVLQVTKDGPKRLGGKEPSITICK